jgi:hypothetical protein
MSNAHTPGPWVLTIKPAEHDADFTVAEIEQPRAVKYRGAVTRLQSAEHIDGIGKDELIANARLIAAAPDMLEALKELLTDCPDETFRTGQALRRDQAAALNGAILMAKDAIAKAEGRT